MTLSLASHLRPSLQSGWLNWTGLSKEALAEARQQQLSQGWLPELVPLIRGKDGGWRTPYPLCTSLLP